MPTNEAPKYSKAEERKYALMFAFLFFIILFAETLGDNLLKLFGV